MANRVFIFHETTHNFRAFQFDGTAQTGENWSPGFTTIGGAAANYTHIYVLDTAPDTPIVRVFDASQARQTAMDITMNSDDTYAGIALTPTHLVAINQTDGKLEYYDLTTRAYDATKDVTLPSQTSPEVYSGICRSGNFLYLTTHNDSTFAPRIYKRNLDGSAVSNWAGQSGTLSLTMFATRDRINIVRKNGGLWDRFAFDGTADTTLNTIGAGVWAGSYTIFDLATVAFSTPVKLANGDYQFNATWTDGHTDFAQDDLSVNHGTISSFLQTPTANVFQIEVSPPSTGAGTLKLTIREDAVTEKNAEITFTVGTFDNTPAVVPATLRLNFPVSVLDQGETRTLTLSSDMGVTLTERNITVTGGATLSNFQGSGTSYTVDVTAPATGAGEITLSIAEDALPETNHAASLTIAYRDITAPTITFDVAQLNVGGTAKATITHPIAVTEFVEGDVTVGGGTPSNFTAVGTDNRVWTVDVTAPASGQGTITVSIAADVVPERNAAASASIAYSTPPTDPEEPASNAPTDVSVDLTPTTALITWKAPTNGVSITGYEISYEEGASPGTTWIPTERLSTRFFVKGLKRGTEYTFGVRARNDVRAGDESIPVTQRTPIASLHNALFFKECVNYFDEGARISVHGDPTHLVRAVGDNNYQTFTREKDLVLNIAIGGNPTRVDAIFVKGIDIEGHSAEPTGGTGSGYSNRQMPETVKNWEGTEVSTIVAGFQHDLYLLDRHFTAKEVRMTFTGQNARIYEVMCLEFGISIDANGDFTEINTDFVDREGVIHSDPSGGIVYDSPIGADDRDKWEVDFTVRILPNKTLLQTPEEFLYWRADNKNHVFAMEPSRFPWRVFPATFVRRRIPIRYRTDDKTGGEIINFRVAEQ